MLLINLAAAVLSARELAWLLRQRGASPWLPLTVIVSLDYPLTIRIDLNEPLALGLVLLS